MYQIQMEPDKIDKMFDLLDETLVDALNEHKPSFEEIHIVLWRLNKKVEEQELQLYFQYFKEEGTDSVNLIDIDPIKKEPKKEEKEPDGSMYG